MPSSLPDNGNLRGENMADFERFVSTLENGTQRSVLVCGGRAYPVSAETWQRAAGHQFIPEVSVMNSSWDTPAETGMSVGTMRSQNGVGTMRSQNAVGTMRAQNASAR
jgi:hypothetical protein